MDLKERSSEGVMSWTLVVQLIHQLDAELGQVWSELVPGLPSRKSNVNWLFFFLSEVFIYLFFYSLGKLSEEMHILSNSSFSVQYAFGNCRLHLNVLSFLGLVIRDVLFLWDSILHEFMLFGMWHCLTEKASSVEFVYYIEWTQVHWLQGHDIKIISLCLRGCNWSLFALWLRNFCLTNLEILQ